MVIGQILGLPIAFGSGQLSGAGFGPNYTILMKLGYEFYAPRILDEMQKNPTRSFEDTEYWRAFQTHLKSYTDKVMTQTMDSLAAFPKATLDALVEKFGSYITDPLEVGSDTTATSTSASVMGQLHQIRLDIGQAGRGLRDPLQQGGSSLFEKDEQRKREAAQAERIGTAEETYTTGQREFIQKDLLRRQETTNRKIDQIINRRPTTVTKRRASQSVKIERQKLITEIAASARKISLNKQFAIRPELGSNKAEFQRRIVAAQKALQINQIKLAKLLTLYQF